MMFSFVYRSSDNIPTERLLLGKTWSFYTKSINFSLTDYVWNFNDLLIFISFVRRKCLCQCHCSCVYSYFVKKEERSIYSYWTISKGIKYNLYIIKSEKHDVHVGIEIEEETIILRL